MISAIVKFDAKIFFAKIHTATARITLFSVGSSRLRALIGLVTRLLAIITKPFRFGASVSKMTD